MRIVLLLTFLMAFNDAVSCDCHSRSLSQNQAQSYESSNLIFIGYVIKIDTTAYTYQVEVIELLKGEAKQKVIKGISPTSCSGFPSMGLWILYAFVNTNGEIEFDLCGMSRSFLNPQHVMVNDYTFPPPLLESKSAKYTDAYLDFSHKMLALKEKALEDLKKEIIELRKRI